MVENSHTPESGNSQSIESKNTPSPSSSSSGNPPTGKNSKTTKGTKGSKGPYGKINLHLLLDHEHALRLASVLLERAGDPISTLQLMVDEAAGRYIDFLQVKKGIDFQGIVPKKQLPNK